MVGQVLSFSEGRWYSVELVKTSPKVMKNPVNTPLSVALKAAFREGTVVNETDTVLQCIEWRSLECISQ